MNLYIYTYIYIYIYIYKAIGEWNINVKHILEKSKIKTNKNEDENFRLFIKSSYMLQNLMTQILIHSDHEIIITFLLLLLLWVLFGKFNFKVLFSLTLSIEYRI